MEHMTMGVGILAGGKSSRMGHDKAFLPYGNGTFLSRLLQEFSGFDEVLVSVAEDWDHERLAENVDCGSTCVFVVTDEKKDIGPLEGLRQILKHTNQEYVFVCAVDMPFVTKKLAEYISGYLSKDYDCYCIADEEHVHPLCGIYSRHMLPVVEAQIERGEYCVSAILGAVNTKYISLKYTVFDTRVTANINTKEEYGKLCTPAVFCVSGIKNAGKTGLILQLVQAFLRDGCRVGVIKHDGHEYQMDHEGTDTDRFSKAGSTCSAIYHRDH
jgi:molybdopterin-guanine dinucleotide biosynthesis protein